MTHTVLPTALPLAGTYICQNFGFVASTSLYVQVYLNNSVHYQSGLVIHISSADMIIVN